MSGHNKWSSIKHKKAVTDAKKGKVFAKVIKEIVLATKEGGQQIENNARLRKAIEDAKEINMPQNNIKKAIQRGSGETSEKTEEIIYEGYGPTGVAVIVKVTTNNKNRTASNIRKIFLNYGGNLGEVGCVSWMFSKKGYITVNKSVSNEEVIMNIVLDAGAEDFKSSINSNVYEIITSPLNFEMVKKSLEEKNILFAFAEITMLPQTRIILTDDNAVLMLKFINELKEYADVRDVYANFDISNKNMEKIK
ncbi:MAG: YebC/PmpR family DNA-binding transcriptional regulator [Endomicrobium sp.]|jgi:YebC/PmpR family DNA-binding regulatory protein|nr:YebC/PmpR family DNA-binding transcriptional regulator [Endomicrobium sp.]